MTGPAFTEAELSHLTACLTLAVNVHREGCHGIPADAPEYFTTYDFAEAVRRYFGTSHRPDWRWCESVLLRIPSVRNVGEQTWRYCKPWSWWRRSRRAC